MISLEVADVDAPRAPAGGRGGEAVIVTTVITSIICFKW